MRIRTFKGIVEVWKSIPKYEGLYEASNLGRIRGLDRVAGKNKKIKKKGILLVLSSNTKGLLQVTLSKEGDKHTYLVSHIVLQTFEPNLTNYAQVKYLDGNYHNCALDNLKIVEPSIYNLNKRKYKYD